MFNQMQLIPLHMKEAPLPFLAPIGCCIVSTPVKLSTPAHVGDVIKVISFQSGRLQHLIIMKK